MARTAGARFLLQAASGGEKRIAQVNEYGSARRVDAALHDVAQEFPPGFDDAAGCGAAEPTAESGGDKVAVFVSVGTAEGETADAGQAAAASSAREMVAACIIFASALSGFRPAF